MKRGFSLVELSIVLVILGLLIGGILAGKSLIRAAELRSVNSDVAKYRIAIAAFRDKYFGLPGDITNATLIWGKDNAACSGNSGTAATPGTCNGNGDGFLRPSMNEDNRAWQQLALAGLIEGSYLGNGTGYDVTTAAGQWVPAGRISGSAFNLYWATSGGANSVDTADPNRLIFGKPYAPFVNFSAPILTPDESWNIDTKIDDGLPTTGKLIAMYGSGIANSCTSGNSYVLTTSFVACFLMYNAQ